MKVTMRLAVWIAAPALLVGLVLGVAIGRSRTPFVLSPSLTLGEPNAHIPLDSSATPPISVADLRTQMDSGNPITLIDVREPEEYAVLHIPSGKSIPLGAIWARQSEIPREGSVVVYCSSDLRGEIAARELIKLGYRNVKYLDGGISAWQNAGLAVVR